MHSEGFPFIVWGLDPCSPPVGRRVVFVNSVSMGEAAKPRLFCCAHVAVSMGEAAKPISSRVSACPLASPCLWGKLQNLVRFAALTSPCLWGKLQNLSSTGKCFGASFVVHSSTGNDFVQTL